jgi:hypothetical protein
MSIVLVLALAVAGCVTAPPATRPAAEQRTFTGEVWLWDEQANTVTLRQGTELIRVKVSPEQLAGLRLHQTVTVRGEPARLEVEHRVLPPGALVARGPAVEAETSGTVRSIDPAGLVSIESPRGVHTVWIGSPGAQPFQAGQPVRVRVRVQPLEIVPPKNGERAEAPELAAAVGTEPGEYAVVRGRITAVDPAGRLTVSSQRGPVTLAAPGSYRVGDWVEVRTEVHPVR